jgi:hypothetical protein
MNSASALRTRKPPDDAQTPARSNNSPRPLACAQTAVLVPRGARSDWAWPALRWVSLFAPGGHPASGAGPAFGLGGACGLSFRSPRGKRRCGYSALVLSSPTGRPRTLGCASGGNFCAGGPATTGRCEAHTATRGDVRSRESPTAQRRTPTEASRSSCHEPADKRTARARRRPSPTGSSPVAPYPLSSRALRLVGVPTWCEACRSTSSPAPRTQRRGACRRQRPGAPPRSQAAGPRCGT